MPHTPTRRRPHTRTNLKRRAHRHYDIPPPAVGALVFPWPLGRARAGFATRTSHTLRQLATAKHATRHSRPCRHTAGDHPQDDSPGRPLRLFASVPWLPKACRHRPALWASRLLMHVPLQHEGESRACPMPPRARRRHCRRRQHRGDLARARVPSMLRATARTPSLGHRRHGPAASPPPRPPPAASGRLAAAAAAAPRAASRQAFASPTGVRLSSARLSCLRPRHPPPPPAREGEGLRARSSPPERITWGARLPRHPPPFCVHRPASTVLRPPSSDCRPCPLHRSPRCSALPPPLPRTCRCSPSRAASPR